MASRFELTVPRDYVLRRDYCSYGYFLLEPNDWDPKREVVTRVLELAEGPAKLEVVQPRVGGRIKRGAALGANSTIRCGITIGEWAMVGSGSVVTKDVPAHGLVYGNPAKLHGFVCACGEFVKKESQDGKNVIARCPKCSRTIEVSNEDWERQK